MSVRAVPELALDSSNGVDLYNARAQWTTSLSSMISVSNASLTGRIHGDNIQDKIDGSATVAKMSRTFLRAPSLYEVWTLVHFVDCPCLSTH